MDENADEKVKMINQVDQRLSVWNVLRYAGEFVEANRAVPVLNWSSTEALR